MARHGGVWTYFACCAALAACGSASQSTAQPGPNEANGADSAPPANQAESGPTAEGSLSTPDDAALQPSVGTPPSVNGDTGVADGPLQPDAGAVAPVDLSSSMIYCVFPTVYSAAGNLAAVTADLHRVHDLGFDVLWIMPVTPIGQAVGGHPAFGSPYSVKDYDAINPAYGTSQDLVDLVRSAHALGMRVVLDEVLNHTSWDNALIQQHPEFYLHSDGNSQNASSIEQAFNYSDVAQLDYKTPQNGLAKYMSEMVVRQIRAYDVDGFRFDSADNPYGANRMIPASFWQGLRPQLEAVKPGILMLGEEEDPALAQAPFELDYGWHLEGFFGSGGLQQVAKGADATLLEQQWTSEKTGYPVGMRHMTLLQDYDLDLDLNLYGGAPNALAAATFVFTIDGLPLLYNGEEIGNDMGGVNSQKPIHWNGPNAAAFSVFYRSLLLLRAANPALQQGSVAWIANGGAAHVVSYTRSAANATFLVVINFSGTSVAGTLSAPFASSAAGWVDVSPVGSPGGTAHPSPPSFTLKPYDFAVFRAK